MSYNIPHLLPESALSVSGLTSYIQALLQYDEQLQQIWVTGEVSSANRHTSGLFFTLQDPDAKVAISCVVWSSQLDKLIQLPTRGEQLIVLGGIQVYRQRGEYRLNVFQALPAGEGLQALRYRQLRSRLEAEGLFAKERKRQLPTHPQTIAVVTSPQAAAWGDIQRTLKYRYPGLHVLFSPAIVQGEQAPPSIVAAIERVQRDGRAQVLILARGGGAVEELACFNDERVVRVVATCSIPVITGIGHQRDESLADLVADVCAHTPTAAAEQVVPELASLVAEHRHRQQALNDTIQRRILTSAEQLQRLKQRLQHLPIAQQLHRQKQAIASQRHRLSQATSWRLQQATQHCQLLQSKLATLDPKAVLQRGYAVVRQENGAIARSTEQLTLGEELHIQLGHGEIKVKIIDVSE